MIDRFRTEFEVADDRFTGYTGDEYVEVLYRGGRKSEGPAYFAAGRFLVWSDIPNDRMLRWDETTGEVGVFRQPSGYSNGNTIDRQGRLISCEQGNRRVTRTEPDGSITVLADAYDGKRLNSPNDVVVRSDGSIWFTDPRYGITGDYEGQTRLRTIRRFDVEGVSNLTFGGPRRNNLFVTTNCGDVYSIRVGFAGVKTV